MHKASVYESDEMIGKPMHKASVYEIDELIFSWKLVNLCVGRKLRNASLPL